MILFCFSSEDDEDLAPTPSKHKRLKTKSQLDQIAKKLSPNRSDLDDDAGAADAAADVSDYDDIDELVRMSDDEVVSSKKVAKNSTTILSSSDLSDNDQSTSNGKGGNKDPEETAKKLPKVGQVSESEGDKSPKKALLSSNNVKESPLKAEKSPKKCEKSPKKVEKVKESPSELDTIRAKVLLSSSSEGEEAVGKEAQEQKKGRKLGKQVTSKNRFSFLCYFNYFRDIKYHVSP